MAVDETILARIAFDPGSKLAELNPIPWPSGLAPTPEAGSFHDASDPLPAADVLMVTYTVAEGRALADVLTPGVLSSSWHHYTNDWSSYVPLLGQRAPALESKRLGSWYTSRIGTRSALCFKSELHPATDGPDLPMLKLWAQIVGEVAPKLVVTTGTAGGVGVGTQLGDVAVARAVQWDCQRQFEAEPWAKTAYPAAVLTTAMTAALATTATLMAANETKIPAEYRTRAAALWEAETTVTTDFFAIGDTTDHYGLVALAPDCRAVEMDDAALFLALGGSTPAAPPLLSVRNASDPVMDGTEPIEDQIKQASAIYEKYGYFTTVNSAIACWALVTALG
jgi:hypothetical protein